MRWWCGSSGAPAARPRRGACWWGAVWLAIGGAFLASVLATPPFAALAILAVNRRAGAKWRAAVGEAVLFAAICGALFLALAAFGYVAFSGLPLTPSGLEHSVIAKADLRPVLRAEGRDRAHGVRHRQQHDRGPGARLGGAGVARRRDPRDRPLFAHPAGARRALVRDADPARRDRAAGAVGRCPRSGVPGAARLPVRRAALGDLVQSRRPGALVPAHGTHGAAVPAAVFRAGWYGRSCRSGPWRRWP